MGVNESLFLWMLIKYRDKIYLYMGKLVGHAEALASIIVALVCNFLSGATQISILLCLVGETVFSSVLLIIKEWTREQRNLQTQTANIKSWGDLVHLLCE